MATLSTFQKFREEQEKKKQGGQQSTQQSTQQSGQKSTGLMNSYQQFMAKQQGQETAYTPESDYGQRVMDVIGKAGNSAASRNGEWTADASGGNAAEINALLREYDAYTGDKSGMTEYRNALLDYNKRIQSENQYYAGFGTKDDFNRVRSGYTNFGVGYDPRSYGLDDASARKLRQESAQNDAKEAQRALAELNSARKAFAAVDSEWRAMDERYRSFTIDEYDKDLTQRWQAAKDQVTAAENALLNARNRMDAYNATWGKVDKYGEASEAAKGTDTSYTGPGYESIADWENRKNEEQAAQDAQAQRPDYVPGTLRYTSDTEPTAEDRLGLWRSLTPEQKQDAVSSSNVQLNNIVMAGNDGYWDLLTDNEVETYYYIKGQQGQEAANQYLDDMYIELSRRNELKTVQSIENANGWEKAGLTAVSVGANLVGAIPAALGKTADMVAGRTNPYSSMQFFQRYASYIRGSVGQDIGDWTESKLADKFGEKFAAKAGNLANQTFQALMSGVDSMAGAMTFGQGLALPAGPFDFHVGGYTTVMGMGAFAQRAQELELKGATPMQIAIGSIGSGILEALFEDVSMEVFFTNILDNPAKTAGEFVKKLAIQMGVEGSEEMFTEMGNIILDAINMGKNSENSMAVREYMAQGMTEEKARQQVWKDNAVDILWAGYGGAISAGAMAAGGQLATDTVRKAGNTIGNYSVGDTLTKNGRYVDLQEQANALQDQKKSAKLSKAAQEVAQKASAGDKSIGNKYRMGKVASQIARQAGREASKAETTEFRNAAEKYFSERRDIQDKKRALNVLTRAYDGTTIPGDSAAMRRWGNQMTREILEGIGGKQTLQENAKARAASAIKTAVDVQSSVLGFEPTKGETAFEYNQEGDTQAYLKDSSDPVNIRAEDPVAKIENGKMWLNTDDGQTVEADNVSFGTAEDASLASIVSRMNITADQANSLYAAKDSSNLSTQGYATALQNAYLKGFSGVTYNGIQDYSAAAKLPGDVRRTAWEAGRQMRNRQTTEQAAKISKGTQMVNQKGLTFTGSAKSIKNLNEQQKAGIAAAKALAAAGLNIEVYASTEAERAKGAPNGFYRSSDGTVHIDLNAGDNGQGTVAYVVAHEATHFIKDLSADKYQIYADILIEAVESKGISYDSLLDRQLAKLSALEENRGKTAEELQELAYDETIAEMSETLLTDTDATQRVSQELYKKDRTLWEKIRDFFTGLVEKLRSAYKGLDPDSDMGRITRQAIRDNEKVAQAWAEALVEAGENYSAGQTGAYEDLLDVGTQTEETSGAAQNVKAEELLQNTQQVEEAENGKETENAPDVISERPAEQKASTETTGTESRKAETKAVSEGELSNTDKRRERLKDYLNEAWSKGDGSAELRDALQRMWSDEYNLSFQTDDEYRKYMEDTLPDLEAGDTKTIAQVRQDFATPTAKFVHENRVNAERDAVRNLNMRNRAYENARNIYGENSAEANTARYFVTDAEQKLQKIRGLNEGMYAALEGRNSEHERVTRRYQDLAYKEFYGREAALDGQKNNARGGERHSPRVGTAEDGRSMYEGNFPMGTPKSAKSAVILEYIQNVWSKKPIQLDVVGKDGTHRKIMAQFDPFFDSVKGKRSDASKIAGGNRHGTSAEQRVTLDLGPDYHSILSESRYNYSKGETGKDTFTHEGVKTWHYYVDEIYFAEKGSKEFNPYTVSINVKEKDNGAFVYSFSAEKGEFDTPGTLHAPVSAPISGGTNAKLSIDMVAQDGVNVNGENIRKSSRSVQNAAESQTETENFKKWFGDWQNDPAKASKVVNEDGTPKVVYHQTAEDFTIFEPRHQGAGTRDSDTPFGIFMKSSDKNIGVKGEKQMALYAKIVNPLMVIDRADLVYQLKKISPEYVKTTDELRELNAAYQKKYDDATKAFRDYILEWRKTHPDASRTALYDDAGFNEVYGAEDNILDEWESEARKVELRSKEAITRDLENNGYDGVIIQFDKGSWGRSTDAYIALHPEQVKSATDNIGTFDAANPDIRYSSRNGGESQVDRLARKNEELKAEAEYLRQVVQIQKKGNSRNLRDRESVNAIAKSILESVNAKDGEFGKKLNDFYRDMVSVEMDYDTMQERAGELADRVLEHHQAERDGYAQEVLDFLKKRRVSLTESQIGDAEYTYGSLSEFKKAIKGSIIIDQNSTTSLDQLWQEATAQFPDQFSADTVAADMPDGIANVVSWATNAEADSEAEFQYYKAETKADLTQKILMGFLDAKPIESVSDTLKQQMADLKKQHQQEMRELRKSWDAEAKAMEQSHQYDLEAERKRGKAAVEALKYQQEVIQKAQKGLWETERADIKRSYEKQMKELREQNTQKAHEKVESRHRTEERHKLQNTVDTLNRMLLRPTNTSHVPQELQSSVAMALKVINGVILDSKAGQNADRLAKYAEQLRELEKNPSANAERIADLNRKIGDLTGRDISMKAALTSLQEQYAKLEGQDGGLYDENIEALIADARETIGNTAYKDLSLDQLKAVRDTYTALLTTIRDANKAFVAGQNARIDDMVKRVTGELSAQKRKKPTQTAIGKKIDQFFWNNEKPVYAFERIGSAVMNELYRNLRNGEDTFYRDVNSAREFFLGAAEKNGFDKWNLDELQEFEASNGQKFQLSLDERMSLYAYSLRPQARDHLTKGGIVLAENTKRLQRGPLGVTMEVTYDDANAYTLTNETIDAIVGSLTKEQRQFAFEMQQYLAKVMGAKGDEVNMAMYGIKKFGEETYWPLKSSGVFSERIREQQERTGNKQKNKGFTKALTQHANNAIELSSLTETWAEHVNDMSMYHAFTLPMEDFYRVYNWTQKGDTDGKRTMGVRQMIQQTAGKGAVTYIDQFLKDLNGGLRADPRETVSKAMLSGFKKAAVSASLSVAIQQPSAVGRALAYIEANYFVGGKVESAGGIKETWEQLKKYAAVAGLKEMGRFDVDMGQSTLEYIIGRNSVNAWGKFTDKVDELSGWLPEMADQVTWCGIWEAAKRKTAAQNPGLKGEALLQKAGELFTDTITRTQVYDSVFSRSANMRAKSGLMSMATAFMAEPTTTANMVEDAVRKFARGDKRMAGKVMSSVAVATVLNAALASVVYAARDDDEDKTYWEKYLASLAGETVDSFNPLTYIPVLSDINNLFMGYSVERTDMSLASDLADSIKKIAILYGKYDDEWSDEEKKEWEKKVRDAWMDNAWMAGTVMGLPLKNLARDVEAIINTATNPSNGAEMSADTILKGMRDSARSSLPILSWKADESSSDQLYKAITQGKDVLARRMKAQFGDEKKYESALLKGLRENDPRIKEAAQYAIDGKTQERVAIIREIVAEGHYTQDQVIKAINQKANSMKESSGGSSGDTPQKLYDYEEYVPAAANGLGYADEVRKELIRYQADRNQEKNEKLSRAEAEEAAEKTFQSKVKSETKDSYAAGEITEAQARKVLTDAGVAKDEALDKLLLQWNTELELGSEIEWTDSRYVQFARDIQPAGISVSTYDEYIQAVSKMHNIDADGDGKDEIKKQTQVIEYIDSMPISDEQKDILFQSEYPTARKSVLRKLPWR